MPQTDETRARSTEPASRTTDSGDNHQQDRRPVDSDRYAALTGINLAAVTAWATPLLLPGLPTLGSPRWCDLPDGDPAKLSAAVRAGVAYVVETASLPESLARQLMLEDLEVAERIKSVAFDVSSAARWSAQARRIADRHAFELANPWVKRVTA